MNNKQNTPMWMMPKKICKIAQLSFIVLPIVLLALLVGCKPAMELKLPLDADEGFKRGSEVRLNGKVVGKVVETVQEGERGVAILKITEQSGTVARRPGARTPVVLELVNTLLCP